MTQELIIWVLLAGLVALSWLMVVAVTTDNRRSGEKDHAHDASDLKDNGVSRHHRPSHRGMAA